MRTSGSIDSTSGEYSMKMGKDLKLDELKNQIGQWLDLGYIAPEDIPSIELYMDQVTTFMDRYLSKNKRTEEDKTLTKTMINNYTKNDLLPPPNKKRYSKEHIILLIYIYYFKNVVTINDIHLSIIIMIIRMLIIAWRKCILHYMSWKSFSMRIQKVVLQVP